MFQRKNLIFLFLIFLAALPAISQNLFTGIWVCEEEWDGVPVKDYFTFNNDGTGLWSLEDGKDSDSFSYTVGASTIAMKWNSSGETTVYDFTFGSDGSLVLGIDFGSGEGYKKYVYFRVK